MKCFIRRKNNLKHIAALGTALFLMSALAVSALPAAASSKKEKEALKEKQEQMDSIYTARYVFEHLHTSALELLPEQTRLDMLDYWDADSIYKASNALEGLSWIEKLTPDYIKVRITPVSTFEIKILPEKKEKLALTIYTVGDDVQAQDSQVKFYDESLQSLPTDKYIEIPQLKDFFEIPKGSVTKMKEIEEMIPFPTVAISANPDNYELEARLTVEQYINQDDWNIAKLFAKPGVKLIWKKDKFRIEK